jgi:hypothetical protein
MTHPGLYLLLLLLPLLLLVGSVFIYFVRCSTAAITYANFLVLACTTVSLTS